MVSSCIVGAFKIGLGASAGAVEARDSRAVIVVGAELLKKDHARKNRNCCITSSRQSNDDLAH